jgi:HD-GYP domain-containing protein (c-di-GMP phosphodiesterase class II)
VPGFYSGSLILLRERKRAALEDLKLLADQAGVALKDIEAREEGQGAWLGVVRSLVRAIDAKSTWTRGHSERVAALSTAVGRCLFMDGKELAWLEMAAVLHDVGKIGVREAILDKPGRLDPAEIAEIERHTIVGAGIVEDLPSSSPVREAILYHHERWDGSGYPTGLSGEDIPLAARIIALADVYDAITDDRPYRKGMSLPEARDFLLRGAGSLFDPRLVRLFLETIAAPETPAAVARVEEAPATGSEKPSPELVDCP